MRLFILFFLALFVGNQTYSQILFKEEANILGIDETCGTTYLGNGISFVDYDQDGWDDISFATGNGLPVRFFKNNNGVKTFFVGPGVGFGMPRNDKSSFFGK